jgi:AraC family transcriptional regulator
MRQTVEDFLSRSNGASATGKLNLGTGCGVVIWENRNDRVRYERPENHTFSLYLKNGTGTRRLDAGGVAGWPGAVCIMPAGHQSDWEITTPFQFVHLYLSDEKLRSTFSEIHDCDARRLNLGEENFVKKPEVTGPLAELARAARSNNTLQAETALVELIGRLRGSAIHVSGGLPPYVLRRVEEYIDANLSGSIHLGDLARLADMSGFHFHRMFRLARGSTPHDWITQHRVRRAKTLLRTEMSIAEVAVECGFSSQSHLTRVFREQAGCTPGQFRRACRM